MEPTIYRLKVTLRHTRPPIWRRIEVRSDLTLGELHHVLQIAMGWTDSHLHQFWHGETCYGPADPDLDLQGEQEDEQRVRLDRVLRQPKERLRYEYDFGDGWNHYVVLERSVAGAPDTPPFRVTGGKGACPPEDVGGIGGYYGFLRVIADATHPEHDHLLEWCGGAFDPDAFDIEGTNRRFEVCRQRPRPRRRR